MTDDLISRQAAVDALWKAFCEYEDKTEKQFQESDELGVGDWIIHRMFVQNMSDIDRRTLLDLPSAQTKQQWIPVTEWVPKKERKNYWVCTDSGYQCECRWTNSIYGLRESGDWGWSIFDIPQYSKVVAWMPLPEPYREEKRECGLPQKGE